MLSGINTHPSEKEEVKKIVETVFNGLSEDEANNLRRLVTILFPRQQNTIYGSEWDKTWVEQKRIASDKYFDRYFTYSIPIGDVSDIRINEFIVALDGIEPEELMRTLGEGLTAQNAEAFISKLHQKIEKISSAGQVKLAILLSLFGGRFPSPKELFSFRSPFSRGALLVSYLIEAQINDESRYGLAIEVINVAEPITFALEVVRWLRRKDTENSVISSDNINKINKALANRIETLMTQGVDFFDEYRDQAPHLLWYWREFGSKENMDKYLNEYLAADTQNVSKLLDAVVPIAYPMDGSTPHKSEFERSQYDYLRSFADLNLIYDLLKIAFGEKLDSEQYPYDFDKPLDIRFAKQFAWIHKKVLDEKQNSGEGSSDSDTET